VVLVCGDAFYNKIWIEGDVFFWDLEGLGGDGGGAVDELVGVGPLFWDDDVGADLAYALWGDDVVAVIKGICFGEDEGVALVEIEGDVG